MAATGLRRFGVRRTAWASILSCLLAGNAAAQDMQWHGYLDLRAVAPDGRQDWSDGALGKTRYGGHDDAGVDFGAAALGADFQLTPQLLASTQLQYVPQQRQPLDVIDAYLRYRPVSTTRWRWSLKAGAFFPPISLENDSIGWTSPWTLTPSAINSWVGEELRTFGLEWQLEHRGDTATITGFTALFGNNDPAGELLAARGWALGDLTSGIDARLREPDVFAGQARAPVPVVFRPFDEVDGRIGGYAGLAIDAPAYGRLSVLRYDNRADPSRSVHYAGRNVFAWHTRFWSAGGQTQLGDVVLIGQAMIGSTAFQPAPERLLDTRMSAGYVLAAWDRGAWRPALRVDLFRLRQLPTSLPAPLSEHGNAFTAALNWRPDDRVRITGEWLRIDSHRDQRRLQHFAPRQIETQLQLSVRLLF